MCLKMSKDIFCLCFCVHGLEPTYVAWTYAYAALFLRLCVLGDGLTYVGSCLCMQALTCIRQTPGRGFTLLIFTSLSTVSLLYVILTPLFVIFAYDLHPSFYLHSCIKNIIFHHFHLNPESNVIFFFCSPHPLILVGEAPTRWWSGTTSLFPRSGLAFGKQASSLSLAFYQKGLQVLP